jgi:hypothetical protein
MLKEPWIAHDAPNRRFDAWMWLDDCQVCLEALKREAEKRPRLVFCLKTSSDRIYVTAELLHETMAKGDPVESLCYVEDDWVRESFVVRGPLPPGVSWWSLTLIEEMRQEMEASQN